MRMINKLDLKKWTLLPVLLAAILSFTACGVTGSGESAGTSAEAGQGESKSTGTSAEEGQDESAAASEEAGQDESKSTGTSAEEGQDESAKASLTGKPDAASQKDEKALTSRETSQENGEASDSQAENGQEIVVPELKIETADVPLTDAMAFVSDMGTGWCLGNTLDAFDDGRTFSDELLTETCWGNPAATQQLVDAVYEAGFRTIRIPTTWHGHVTMEKDGQGGYTITVSQAWLDRVQEVVDYAYEKGMYVILNIHHDTNVNYYYPDSAHYEQSKAYFEGVWEVIARRFRDYDRHLIFESINEPRLAGTGYEWNFNDSAKECQDSADCINRLNQVFVDTVRVSGGNNGERYLMVPGYGASVAGVTTDLFVLPTDTAKDKLIVSTHAYIPYNFALQAPGEGGSGSRFQIDAAYTREINMSVNKLYEKFVSQGIPVVMGEYGARDKGGNLQDRVNYYAYYVAYARSRGITCCTWDNGYFEGDGERFGIFDRTTEKIKDKEIVEAIMKYANAD